jgi:hypothetical protein
VQGEYLEMCQVRVEEQQDLSSSLPVHEPRWNKNDILEDGRLFELLKAVSAPQIPQVLIRNVRFENIMSWRCRVARPYKTRRYSLGLLWRDDTCCHHVGLAVCIVLMSSLNILSHAWTKSRCANEAAII